MIAVGARFTRMLAVDDEAFYSRGHSTMRRDPSTARIIAAICAAYLSQASSQQRAQDNAVTAAEDAFGTSIGLQNVGLYSQI